MGLAPSLHISQNFSDEDFDLEAKVLQTFETHSLFREWSIQDVRYALELFPSNGEIKDILQKLRSPEGATVSIDHKLQRFLSVRCTWQ